MADMLTWNRQRGHATRPYYALDAAVPRYMLYGLRYDNFDVSHATLFGGADVLPTYLEPTHPDFDADSEEWFIDRWNLTDMLHTRQSADFCDGLERAWPPHTCGAPCDCQCQCCPF